MADLSQLPTQILQAISIAISQSPSVPTDQRHQAYLFLTQVKEAALEPSNGVWSSLFGIALDSSGKWSGTEGEAVRMFAAGAVGDCIPKLPADSLKAIETSLFEYLQVEFISGNAENNVVFLKNAIVHLFYLLFFQSYPHDSPTFFKSFLSLLRQHPSTSSSTSSPSPFNPSILDMFLRLLHEVATEISDVQLRLNKSVNRLAKDGELRDAIRVGDASDIATALWETINEALDGLEVRDGERVGLTGGRAREVAEMAIRVAGDYVSWIDINLMITPSSIPLLLRALSLPSPIDIGIRSSTLSCLIETLSKGMPAGDKIALLGVLDIGNILGKLSEQEGGDEFGTKLAQTLNVAGLELCKIVDDSSTPPDIRTTASTMISTFLPLLLRFISSPVDDTSSAVSGFATSLLSQYKKEKKRAGPDPSASMTEEKRLFLTELLKATFAKMEYKEDHDWTLGMEGEEEEEELVFAEMRKNLRAIGDAIGWIDPELYGEAVRSIVLPTIDALDAGGATAAALPWQRLELSIYLLYGLGQALNTPGPGAFVKVPISEVQRAKREADYRIDYTQFPLSLLGEMMLRTCRSGIVKHSHPAVCLQFFEIVVRYHDFFRLCPEYISEILPSFLDEHGLHQPEESVRARVFYLFSRFIYAAKAVIQAQVSGEIISNILTRIQDLLTITAELEDPATEEILLKTAGQASFFNAQLYLFESVGTLISILNQIPEQQLVLLRAVLSPLLAGLQQNARTSLATQEDFVAVLLAHHNIMAIGNVAKGFPDLSARAPQPQGRWVEVFTEATQELLVVTKKMAHFLVIRDAARFAFNRFVTTTGEAILPFIPALIECLLDQVTFAELAELMSFLGLLVAKYKVPFQPLLDTLLMPVFDRVFHFLKLPIAGTDDTIQHSTLRRAYFGFILSIASANLQEVFYSEKNKSRLQDVLASIPHYIANDSLAPDQRQGFLVLNKFIQLWVDIYRPPTAPPAVNGPPPSPVPGFEQFLYQQVAKLCFEVPLRPDFDYSDAQSYQVIGEIANFLKGLLVKRGSEFVAFMETDLLPSIQCPPDAAKSFMTALQEAPDGKQFKKFAGDWLRRSRGAPPQ